MIFKQTRLASEVTLVDVFSLFCLRHLLLAVDKAAEERLVALATLVEGAFVKGELERLLIEVISFGLQALILQQSLILSDLHGLRLNFRFELEKVSELLAHRVGAVETLLDRCLTAWAAHEGERDLQSRPLVSQELADAFEVENVPAAELEAGSGTELLCETDCAQFVLVFSGLLAA